MQLPCAKTREFGEAEFSDCLPVSALVCVFAFDTGGLGLWLGAFGWSKLYRCQSVPGPPMPCFVAQSFQPPVHRASLLGLETHVLPIALCKSTRIRLVPNSWDSYAGFLWHRAFSLDTQSFFPPVHRAFSLGAQSFVLAAFATLVCQRNCVFLCKGTKLKIVMPVFCGTELRFRRLCNFDLPNKQRFSLQRHKSTRIRLVPNSWDSYAGFL